MDHRMAVLPKTVGNPFEKELLVRCKQLFFFCTNSDAWS